MSNKIQFDMKLFREAKSCSGSFYLPAGSQGCVEGDITNHDRFCAQGKLILATTGLKITSYGDWLYKIGFFDHLLNHSVPIINNEGRFKEADDMVLQWAIESG